MAQESRGQPRREQFRARMVEQLGSDSAAALEECLRNPGQELRSLRLNRLRQATRAHFEDLGFKFFDPIAWEPAGFWVQVPPNSDTSPAIGAGLGYLQDAGAMEVVSVLDPQPGDLVMDLCAAPGGKTTQILERLGNTGWLVANDPVRSRAERLNGLAARHGSSRISVLSQDADSLLARFAGVFDKVLVDAPSSSESFFATREDKRLDVPDAEVAGCARRQFLILDRAAQMVRAGGTLVYCTNTYSKAENSDLVASFLLEHPEFELVREQYRFPHLDRVPGGYWAHLKHTGETAPRAVAILPSVSGLLRQSVFKWNGELDQYALAMLTPEMVAEYVEPVLEYRVKMPDEIGLSENFPAGMIELGDDQARAYLGGQAIAIEHAKGVCRLAWRGHPLGFGKSTGDRINNLLPKIMRAGR